MFAQVDAVSGGEGYAYWPNVFAGGELLAAGLGVAAFVAIVATAIAVAVAVSRRIGG